mgnify:CR=1 FL=1
MAESKPKDKPPTSRLGRLARLAGLAPRGIPFAIEGAKRVLGGPRSEEDERAAREKMAVEIKKTAEAMAREVHADPDDSATSLLSPIRIDSPST